MDLGYARVSTTKQDLEMATSFCHVRRGVHGRIRANFNLPDLIRSRQAVVYITAGEITLADGSPGAGLGSLAIPPIEAQHGLADDSSSL